MSGAPMGRDTLVQHVRHLLADVAETPSRLARAQELAEEAIRASVPDWIIVETTALTTDKP